MFGLSEKMAQGVVLPPIKKGKTKGDDFFQEGKKSAEAEEGEADDQNIRKKGRLSSSAVNDIPLRNHFRHPRFYQGQPGIPADMRMTRMNSPKQFRVF
jgi:hypothetical protein